jgi:hypothetical protein
MKIQITINEVDVLRDAIDEASDVDNLSLILDIDVDKKTEKGKISKMTLIGEIVEEYTKVI